MLMQLNVWEEFQAAQKSPFYAFFNFNREKCTAMWWCNELNKFFSYKSSGKASKE